MINLGRHSYCYGVQRGSANDVHIGNFSSIAEGVILDGGFGHDTTLVSTFPFSKIWSELPSNIKVNGDIAIGNDVWVGEGAIIFSGITIGDGAVIGARAVVTNNVDPYYIVVGTPARLAHKRFSPYEIEQLLKIKWWLWDENKIKENAHLFNGSIDEFLKIHKTK